MLTAYSNIIKMLCFQWSKLMRDHSAEYNQDNKSIIHCGKVQLHHDSWLYQGHNLDRKISDGVYSLYAKWLEELM